ncbi:MAG TPA: hydrogenase [Phycisphaerae bacterium]|nr:hydrogenase [Phycisphaerae bacterium]
MSTSILSALLVLVLLLNLFALGTSRIRSLIQIAALQGVLLGVMPLLLHGRLYLIGVLIAVGTILIKGMLIPKILINALRDARIKREVEPLIGLLPSMLLGAAGVAASMIIAALAPKAVGESSTLIIPVSFATLTTGFLLLTTRRKTLTLATGYLLLENGIFIFGLLLLQAMPFLVETGVLLDLFVGIFVIGIILQHINLTLDSLDTRRLSSLKD